MGGVLMVFWASQTMDDRFPNPDRLPLSPEAPAETCTAESNSSLTTSVGEGFVPALSILAPIPSAPPPNFIGQPAPRSNLGGTRCGLYA